MPRCLLHLGVRGVPGERDPSNSKDECTAKVRGQTKAGEYGHGRIWRALALMDISV